MDSNNKKLMQAMCSLHEDDFTKKILLPLFEAKGYDRVCFNGGQNEKGKDLLAIEYHKITGEPLATFIQSKKVGKLTASKTAPELNRLIFQLTQCSNGKIIDPNGSPLKAQYVVLASPDEMPQRIMVELEEAGVFNSVIPTIIYDGPKVLKDIEKFKPELFNLLTNFEDLITEKERNPANLELLSALKSTTSKDAEKFYSDLSFFVGSIDSNILLHQTFSFKYFQLHVNAENWETYKDEVDKFESTHNIQAIRLTVVETERLYSTQLVKYNSTVNQKYIKRLDEIETSKDSLGAELSNSLKTFNEGLYSDNEITKKLKRVELTGWKNVHSELVSESESIKNTELDINDLNIDDLQGSSAFKTTTKSCIDLINRVRKLQDQLDNLKPKIIPAPKYNLKLNSIAIIEKLNQYQKEYIDDIQKFNQQQQNQTLLKRFLQRTEKSLSLISALSSSKSLLFSSFEMHASEQKQDRVSLSPHDVFETGNDIAIYGGAGVGKTTTLEAYDRLYTPISTKLKIYVRLNSIVNKLDRIETLQNDLHNGSAEFLIKLILLSKNIPTAIENVCEFKKCIKKPGTIIIDGLDEAYNTIPSILRSIELFKKDYPNIQFLVSSRDCVSYLQDINFLGITLLPFTEKQLENFIRAYLDDSNKAETLIRAIKDKALYKHLKTPLLATITCHLVDRGIDAPSTETEIYAERLRLLTGEYDNYKQIHRQNQTSDMLKKVAAKLAYIMHVKQVRQMGKSELLRDLVDELNNFYPKNILQSCIEELHNPCDILKYDNLDKTFSFGHFRFQEHLVSIELQSNREIPIVDYLSNDWWRGALCLYAQNNEFYSLIEDYWNRFGSLNKAKITLKAMAENTKCNVKQNTLLLIEDYIRSDLQDDTILPEMTMDYDDYMNY
ncbi:MAG: flagellar biosynthesis GTPase FlhF [Colwellia sp.]|jgi:flagellar biosynthesis GTPase FlhF